MNKLKQELEKAFPARVVLLYSSVIVIKYMTGSPTEYEVARMKIDKTGVIYSDNVSQSDIDKANSIVAKYFNIEGE